MPSLSTIISRVDVDFYEEVLGQPQIRLLNLMSGDYIKIKKLRELMFSLYSLEELLSITVYRNRLFENLKIEEAEMLCNTLGLKTDNNDFFNPLYKIKLQKGSKKEELLYDFFELRPPSINEEIEDDPKQVVAPNYSLFEHQNNICKEVDKILQSDLPKCILHMPTGSGKTRTAMNIIAEHLRIHGGVVVWLAYSKELCDQAIEEFYKAWGFLGNRSIDTYKLWGSYDVDISNIDSGFIVAGFDKLFNIYKKDHNSILALGRKTSLLVIDEAHQSIAPTYETVINLLTTDIKTKMLGLTATPGRTTDDIDKDLRLSKFFSKSKVSLSIKGYSNPVEYLIDQGYLAKVEFKSLYYDGGTDLSEKDIAAINRSLDVPTEILNKIAINEIRNLKIVFEVERLIGDGHKRIILFGTTVQHAMNISSILTIRGIVSKCVTAKTDSKLRDKILVDYKDDSDIPFVLCNYGVLTMGFDAPRTSAAIIARPTKSLVLYSQMVGRAIRGVKAGGNRKAKIVTTVDITLPGFNSIEQAFTNWEDVYNK